MKVVNVEIGDIVVGLDSGKKLSAKIVLYGEEYTSEVRIYIEDQTGIERVKKLIEYSKAIDVSQAKGRIIRAVYTERVVAIGHPIQNRFFALWGPTYDKELTIKELSLLIKSASNEEITS